ncbi:NADP-dependent oxidoreductase domain-containing protein [Thelonectria olida]|uniref:NADP-dependent oxidoreductase domain-containing protein n=1 Tax=Thelonectria olida TaxID=1576542 RepID=A0A9P8W2D1_9HYPO|nr:NADP-dependent oxidoreductase domain-containing protein [Thelonectria olida]
MSSSAATSSSNKLTFRGRISLPNSTTSMPRLGFGVYRIRGDSCVTACLEALDAGYRHIDTADLYRNSEQVRAAVLRSGLDREDVFLTTKVGGPNRKWRKPANAQEISQDAMYKSVRESIARLGGDGEDSYVDLLLIHIPGPSLQHRRALWKALERVHSEGRAKCIGVSNFGMQHLKEMQEYAAIWPPSVNQIELHPWCQQRELVAFCNLHNIVVQAYSPLATGARLDDATIGAVAKKHGISPAQVLVRYSLQKGWVPLPKSGQPDRIRDNSDVFRFEFDEEDMARMDGLDEGARGARFPANVSSEGK